MSSKPKGAFKQVRTPDPKMRQQQEDSNDPFRLHQSPCKFWKFGKCNWGWSCRFMHGSVPEEDPRRAEYRGAPVDFTQFPRPIVSSPHFAASPSYHVEDQSRVKKFRKPVVSFAISNLSLKVQISNLKEILLTSCIDILSNELQTMTTNEVKDLFKGDDPKKVPQSDYIAYIDLSGITLYPDEIPVNSANINMVIQSSWEMKNLNLSLEQLELLTSSELEKLIIKITGDLFENIEETIATLQNETSDAIASSMTSNCKFSTSDLQTLRTKLQQFFAKLNLANSMIADLPIYMNDDQNPGQVVASCPPNPGGLSISTQKVLSYIIGKSLSQIHMCLSHVNRLLGEFKQSRISFAPPKSTSAGMHPTPLCAPVCSSICGEEIAAQSEFGKKLEPEVVVDTSAQYSLSFRNRFDTGFSPFGPSYN